MNINEETKDLNWTKTKTLMTKTKEPYKGYIGLKSLSHTRRKIQSFIDILNFYLNKNISRIDH